MSGYDGRGGNSPTDPPPGLPPEIAPLVVSGSGSCTPPPNSKDEES